MKFFLEAFKGIAIGAGAIIPGVSSGVICVILGIYEKLLNSVLNIFKDFKTNIKIILPILFGGIIGMILFGKILKYLISTYPTQINYIFIGLITGSIPSLLKQIDKKSTFRPYYILYFLISVVIGIFMVLLEKNGVTTEKTEFSHIYLIIAGVCMSIGVVVPGVSSTIILMLLGVYSTYLTSIANMYLPVLIPIGIGLFIGSLVCMKIIKFLLDKFYVQTFYSIIGFTLGSVFVLYPGFTFDINGIISVLCILLGAFISNVLESVS